MPDGDLQRRRILIVEDEYLLARDITQALESVGAEVVGPAPSVESALSLLEEDPHIDGAVLDINLKGEMGYAVADALADRKVPFVFTTGYDESSIPPRFINVPRCEKPIDMDVVARTIGQAIKHYSTMRSGGIA
jgi:CheY-like chemotaxis protein